MFCLDEHDPETPALIDAESGRAWSYGELSRQSSALADHFDFPSKALIFCFCRNDFPSVASYLAALRKGHAVCLLDAHAAVALKRRLIEHYRPDIILQPLAAGSDAANWPEGYRLVAEHPSGTGIWKIERGSPRPLHPSLSLLLSTSGTTGSPKLVRLSTENLRANAESIRECLAIDASERAISGLPIHYSYGLSVLNSHLLSGASLVLTNASVIRMEFWKAFGDHGCSSFAGVPYSYEMLKRIGFEKLSLPKLRTMTQAGGKMRDSLVSEFDALMKRRGGRFVVMYGQTEATARIAYLPERFLPAKLGSAGIAIPGGKLSIASDARSSPGSKAEGEVVYEGQNVMLGYAESIQDLALGDVMAGVLRTGDIGYLDEDGFLYLTGRLKRFSKIYGLRINLDEIEAQLRANGPTAVVGTDEKIVVFCEYGDDAVFDLLRRGLAETYRINLNSFEFRCGDLPLMSSGKVDYAKLQGLLHARG